jgi:hypothetical protein
MYSDEHHRHRQRATFGHAHIRIMRLTVSGDKEYDLNKPAVFAVPGSAFDRVDNELEPCDPKSAKPKSKTKDRYNQIA